MMSLTNRYFVMTEIQFYKDQLLHVCRLADSFISTVSDVFSTDALQALEYVLHKLSGLRSLGERSLVMLKDSLSSLCDRDYLSLPYDVHFILINYINELEDCLQFL